jgi:hypothetical protein
MVVNNDGKNVLVDRRVSNVCYESSNLAVEVVTN